MNTNHPPQISQELFKNVQARDISVRDITQVFQTVNNLNDWDKPLGFPHNIPNSNTQKFIGREHELKKIHQHLQTSNHAVISAIQGMGGIGKTELATQYSLEHLSLKSYPGGICWLSATNQNLGLQIIEFCRTHFRLNPPDNVLSKQVDWCWQSWPTGNTLVVIDDVQNYPAIQPYLPPQSSQFKVLITTRLKLDFPVSCTLSLQILSLPEAMALLSELIGEDRLNQETAQAEELCQRLGYLPLALQLVGRYVKYRQISCAEMLQRLAAKGINHPAFDIDAHDPTWTLSITRGVQAAFELSWEVISYSAQELGCLLSLFALAPIPWLLIQSASREKNIENLENARIELERLHLLQSENYDHYQLHQLIRDFLQVKLEKLSTVTQKKITLANFLFLDIGQLFSNLFNRQSVSTTLKRNFCQAMVNIAQEIPDQPIQKDIQRFKLAIPHLQEVADHLLDTVSDKNLIWVFEGVGNFYEGQGLYNDAEPWRKQCVSLLKQRLGDDHLDVATGLNNLAFLYYSQGKYKEAEPLYQKALTLWQKLLGDNHPRVAVSLNNLAELYHSQGKYKEAEFLYQRSLALRQKLLGDDHPDVATGLNNLALLYQSQGRYNEAEPLSQQALALWQKLPGDNHPRVATSLNNLAGIYKSQGKYKEAEPLYQQALALWKKLLGDDHPDVATSLNNLAELYKSQGKYKEAEPLYQQALALRQKLLGDDHPHVASSLNNLASLYKSQGKYKEAEPLYQQALNIFEQQLGIDHPHTITVRGNLELLRNL
ncbi:tetratricopeptide repeat protein [Anabaena sp. WA102]|uniref:tetratricopeptide repeat protein n=1 Tax=Anabaena sp. WA102 TaxID=1647413 RepID=UPI0009D66939|nr:tetratricopeptide repeat protein [Anabaena sp. WA102]